MPSGRQVGKTSPALLEVVSAWVLAGMALVAVALLPSRDAGGPAYSPVVANFVAHVHPIHAMPGCEEDRDAAEARDSDARAEEPSVPSARARAVLPSIVSGDSESDEC